MKIVIDDIKSNKKVKVGDLVRFKNGSVIFMITGCENKYSWVNLNSGATCYYNYDSLEELSEQEFGRDDIEIYPSSHYSLKLIEN